MSNERLQQLLWNESMEKHPESSKRGAVLYSCWRLIMRVHPFGAIKPSVSSVRLARERQGLRTFAGRKEVKHCREKDFYPSLREHDGQPSQL